jgi:hypothetical protein
MAPIAVRPIALPIAGFDALAAEARGQERDFVDRLEREWRDASNRFAGAGEILLGAFDGDRLVGVGGLNQDPYIAAPRIRAFDCASSACSALSSGSAGAGCSAIAFSGHRLVTEPSMLTQYTPTHGYPRPKAALSNFEPSLPRAAGSPAVLSLRCKRVPLKS